MILFNRQSIKQLIGAVIFMPIAAIATEQGTVPILPESCEISLALSAAPEYLADSASVYVLTSEGMKLHKRGSGVLSCIVNRDSPNVLKPTCFDEEGARTIIPKIIHVAGRLLDGVTTTEIQSELSAAFAEGGFISPQRPGVAYMLSRYNRPANPVTKELGWFPPHVMFYAPNLSNEDIGHQMQHYRPEQPTPMIGYEGPQGYMIMISDDGKPRTVGELDGCPDWVYRD